MESTQESCPPNIETRSGLKPGDLGRIAAIHGELYAQEYAYGLNFEAYVLMGLGEFAHEYDASKDRVWICEHDNQIAGCMFAQHRGSAVQLRYFILLPQYRGLGLGKKLMDEFIRFAKSSRYKHAYLWTTDEQHSAAFLYEKYGFVLTEERQSEAFDKLLMERKYELALNP